ncbi:b3838c81-4f33-4e81-a9d9-0db99c0ff7ae [Sclerotinia trifoliorum]|uniref:B3838c81-4f33-4e81-a9d9-0db99c0ff7ae n=1 Tax=Sclerotinia trifoliorum TaxID=28548 RepID=A0A8H2VMN3_9HELO|nr:b3838c81-4f33-4e81-a9d9-0db99c0ff7ae [Sclerotinia trifoliorum]
MTKIGQNIRVCLLNIFNLHYYFHVNTMQMYAQCTHIKSTTTLHSVHNSHNASKTKKNPPSRPLPAHPISINNPLSHSLSAPISSRRRPQGNKRRRMFPCKPESPLRHTLPQNFHILIPFLQPHLESPHN